MNNMMFDPSSELKGLLGSLLYDIALLKAQNNTLVDRNEALEEHIKKLAAQAESPTPDL